MGAKLLQLSLCVLVMLASVSLGAQISGVVTDAELGEPLIGATVAIKGADGSVTGGTITDFEGSFTVEASAGDVLVVSYTGYETIEVTATAGTPMEVFLSAGVNIEEVVVTGYSPQSTRDITGSVSTIKSENLQAIAPTGVEQALQGQASGVVVGSQGGPGGSAAVRIRGFGTINGNDPLYIIDGTPTGAGLNDLNPNDIESIQVLKDASSAAIYGNRAANGVIIITTKGGNRYKKLTINANAYLGYDYIPSSAFPDMASPQQVAESFWREFTNSGNIPSSPQFGSGASPVIPNYLISQGASTVDESLYDPTSRQTSFTRSNPEGTDWFDEYFDAAITQSYDVSASGGTERSNFFASMSVLDQDGVGYESGFKRYTLRANTTFDLSDRFRIGENITASYSDQITPPGASPNDGTIASLFRLHPLIPVRDVGGNFAGSGVGGLGNGNNAIAIAERNKDNQNLSFRTLGNVYAEFDVIENLTFKTNLGFDILSFNQYYFQPPALEGEIFNTNTWLSERNDNSRTYTWFNTLNYSMSINENFNIALLAGTEYNRSTYRSTTINRTSFDAFTPDVRFFNNASGDWGGWGTGNKSAYFSLFGKADFKFKGKYLLSATIRRDETSVFTKDKRDGVFPSASIGWRASEEDFLSHSNFITDLMFKAGYGEVGNNGDIRTDARSTTLGPNVGLYNYPNSTTNSDPGIGVDLRGNPDISWETTKTLNYGFNARLANSITIDMDIYQSTTEDMLLPVPGDPTLLGNINIVPANLGEMTNNGFDLSIGYDNYRLSGEFQYSIGVNISHYKNEVKFLDPNNVESFINGDNLRDQNPTRTLAGYPISSFYGNTWAGIENGRVVFDELDDAGNPVRGVIGNPHPDFTYGITFNGNYKRFDISFLFQGSQGNDLYNFNKFFTDFNKFTGARSLNYVNEVGLPAVTQDAAIIDREAAASTYYVEDGSYFRMKNVVIGYSLPQSMMDRLGLENIRIYLQGKNLLTITDYTGLDPEVSLRTFASSVGPASLTPPNRTSPGTNLTYGVDSGVYPINRSIIFGVKLTF